MSFSCANDVGWGPTVRSTTDLSVCFEAALFPTATTATIFLIVLVRLISLRRSPSSSLSRREKLFRDAEASGAKYAVVATKLLVYVAACVLAILRAVASQADSAETPTAFQYIQLAGHVAAIFLAVAEFRASQRRSNMLFVYWLALLILDAAFLRAMVDQSAASSVTRLIIASMIVEGLAALVEQVPMSSSSGVREPHGGPLSQATYAWLFPLVQIGYRRNIEASDLPALETALGTEATYRAFEPFWAAEAARPKPSLRRVLMYGPYRRSMICALVLSLVATVLTYAQPLLLSSLLDFFATHIKDADGAFVADGGPEPKVRGIIIAVVMMGASVAAALLGVTVDQLAAVAGLEARSALSGAVYRKSLVLTPTARAEFDMGEITDRLTDDTEEVQALYSYLITLVNIGLQLVLATALVYLQLSWVSFIGVALILAAGPVQTRLMSKLGTWMRKYKSRKDARMNTTTEMLGAMKVVKFNQMESFFLEKIVGLRASELVPLKTKAKGNFLLSIVSNGMSLVAFLAMLGVYSAIAPSDSPLDANRVFVSLSAFQLLQAPLSQLARQLSFLQNTWSSVDRIGDLLCAAELEERDAHAITQQQEVVVKSDKDDKSFRSQNAVSIEGGDFGYTLEKGVVLHAISLKIKSGTLCAIVGNTGSGKTSLLHALLGEMEVATAKPRINGTVAYVAQAPFVMNGTLRENIIFMSPFKKDWFDEVVAACGLTSDIARFAEGIDHPIDESGSNLSGGQKARLALARAVYACADTYLIDDTLSALDARVGRHVFDKVLGPNGLLARTTRIFVTHAVQHLRVGVDQIVYMQEGRILEQGSIAELQVVKDGKVAAILAGNLVLASSDSTDTLAEGTDDGESEEKPNETAGQTVVSASPPAPLDAAAAAAAAAPVKAPAAVVPTKSGSVSWSVYRRYVASSTMPLLALYAMTVVFGTGVALGSRYWLEYWTNNLSDHSIGFYLGIYAAFVFLTVLSVPVSSFIWMGVCAMRASAELHRAMLRTVLRQPMSYFDANPVGRFITRFTMDLGMTDVTLPPTFMSVITILTGMVANIIPAFVNTPILIIVVVPLAAGFYVVVLYYLDSARSLNRLQAQLREPVCSNLSETLEGVATIRAFRCEQWFMDRNSKLVDAEQSSAYIVMYADRWLSLYSNLLGGAVLFGAAILSVCYVDHLSASAVGLGLSYLISWTAMVTMLVNIMGMMNMAMVAVERICKHIDLPLEAPVTTAAVVPEAWPSVGTIEFKNYSTRYTPDGDLVLRDVNLSIRNGEKIGIAGRTGSGKSTLMLALFRLIEQADASPNSGIFIDGIPISTLGLDRLRSAITAIPQEPVLFSGTVRSNLDASSRFADDAIWAALESTSMKSVVAGLEGGLDAPVTKGGDFLSAGQRQLLCIARAILNRTKIVVVDEATSSVDRETDEAVQVALKTSLKDCTVLTIAHRINTIVSADRILCLDAGRVAEFDTPDALMARGGLFADLAREL
ncbi:Canalicular multispecific organic anion transporter 2 [Geranomyces variabilis]|uniref:Canalicular multispecific organic anion transporter 2 n=1 Tax=Geranomyces variabilis TaxID=109894 RepID=A0AAD5XLP5_9FUNG|nr:Canalicular multispecific organic anion transporter 2 [Geranomyces variabilis]